MKTLETKKITFSLLATALLTACFGLNAQDYQVPADAPDFIKSAVESSERPEAATSRDANRMPAEVLMLSGVEPGDTVVEFAGFGQYYTTMLSQIVGDAGKVYMFDLPYTEERAGDNSRAFVASHPNTMYHLENYNTIELPSGVDVVFNVLYYHDLPLNDIDTAVLNEKIFNALNPGGTFLLVDHNAETGSGSRDIESLHRIDPELLKSQVMAAGFELVEENTELLDYPEDDMTQMVFTPGLRGFTDRTVFVFRKPG